MNDSITNASDLSGLAASAGAQRAGLPQEVSSLIGNTVSAIVRALLTHHDPAALARDLAAETAHRTAALAVIQAALDAQGGRHE